MVRRMSMHEFMGAVTVLASAAQRRARGSSVDDELMAALTMLGAAVGFVILFAIAVLVIKRFLFVCGPHEVLVFSGRKVKLADGSTSNFKILHHGWGFRTPFLETVRRMDVRLFPVEVVVENAYSQGQIPLMVRAVANVKISSDRMIIRNAVERFLGQHPSQIAQAAQQTLEGVLREVVSELTPEQVNEDRLKFAESLLENVQDDMHKLGLELDVLKIQHVSDEQEYLMNLGRARIAEMLRDAENAENAANQAVAEAEAASRELAETARKRAETVVAQARNNVRTELAKLEAQAKEVENQAEMAAETEKVKAEQLEQKLRAELEKLRLHCDVVLPAEAHRKAEELKARGTAAPQIEDGKANAEALKAVAQEWAAAGTAGRELYVLQNLRSLADAAGRRVANAQVGRLKLVAGDDSAYGTVLSSHATAVSRVLGETCKALGIDLSRVLAPEQGASGPRSGGEGARRPSVRPPQGGATS